MHLVLHGSILALRRALSRRQSVTTCLHALAVDARGALVRATLLLTAVVDVNDVKGVNVAWDVSEKGEGDVDEDVGAAAGGDEDAYGRDCEREKEMLAWRAAIACLEGRRNYVQSSVMRMRRTRLQVPAIFALSFDFGRS